MIEFYEEQLDQTKNRIIELEKDLSIMHENVVTISEQIKELQIFIIKLAKNQAELSKRISQWPYIAVSSRETGEE